MNPLTVKTKIIQNYFLRPLSILLILGHIFIYPTHVPYCDSFLTCVNIPEDCQKSCTSDCAFGKTFFSPRPQDSNSALRLAKIVGEDHAQSWGIDCTFGRQQSFSRKNNLLAKWLLCNGCTKVSVGVPDDSLSFDVDGRQLGLLTTDDAAGPLGTLSLNPHIINNNILLNAWFDLSDYVDGLWFRTYLNITQTKTDLGMRSCSHAAQSGNYADGAYTTHCDEAPVKYTSLCQAFIGDKPFGDIPALKYGKFYTGTKTKTALTSIRFDINYDFVQSSDGFFNCGACLVVPTGNKPEGYYILEPIAGANKSWQFGAIMLGAYNCCDHADYSVVIYIDSTVTYLLKAHQTRVFSLRHNGAGNQYMLLKVFDTSIGAVLQGERVANIFTGKTHIGGNAMFDGSLMMHFKHRNKFFCDIGYNFWLRSKEHSADKVYLRKFTENTYGVKGNLPLSTIDMSSGFCIGDLTTASNSTLREAAQADDTTQVVEVCDIDINAALHPSAFSHKIFTAFGYIHHTSASHSAITAFIEGEVEIGQKNRAVDQWAIHINVGFSF